MLIPRDQVRPHRGAITPLVAIGFSAGGLTPLRQFLELMPADLHAAFVVIHHFPDGGETHLPEILASGLPFPVTLAQEGEWPMAGNIYVIPPGEIFELKNRRLAARHAEKNETTISAFDTFLQSMSQDYSDFHIAVVLSGSGSDGAVGARALNRAGGQILVQDPNSAEFPGMPQSVILAHAADMVADPSTLAREVVRLVNRPYPERPPSPVSRDENARMGMRLLESLLKRHAGFNIGDYKQESVNRRIERRMGLCHMPIFEEYLEYLQKNPAECENLAKDMLISVTSFFRDTEAFLRLRETVLPGLVKELQGRTLRIWVPACATGEEAYTIAMLIDEAISELGKEGLDYKIFATDLDRRALETASQGIYPASIAADIPPQLLEKYFTAQGETYQIKREVRERMVFARQDILKDPPFNRIDLVSCRNLLIYLQPYPQQRVLSILHFALRMGGVLMLGLSESIGEMFENFGPVDSKNHIFFKKNPSSSTLPESIPFTSLGAGTPSYYQPATVIPAFSENTSIRLLECFTDRILSRTDQTCFVLNNRLEILYSFGQTRRHIGLRQGRASMNLAELLPKNIAAALTTVAARVLAEEKPCRLGPIPSDTEEDFSNFAISVESFRPTKDDRVFLIVFLEDLEDHAPEEADSIGLRESMQRIGELEEELGDSRNRLKATVEELEASNEELQTSNEELQAANEELQSANEELESVNEELQTLNNEHQKKIDELSQANESLDNFISSADIATIFLDSNLRIQRFTPSAARRTGLLPHDQGRAITELSHPLLIQGAEAALKIIAGSQQIEFSFPGENGETIHLRATPYIRKGTTPAGATVTFIPIRNA
ncbi:MAG: CheR family methyltransferase [Terrimicrobiaceae bacterium]